MRLRGKPPAARYVSARMARFPPVHSWNGARYCGPWLLGPIAPDQVRRPGEHVDQGRLAAPQRGLVGTRHGLADDEVEAAAAPNRASRPPRPAAGSSRRRCGRRSWRPRRSPGGCPCPRARRRPSPARGRDASPRPGARAPRPHGLDGRVAAAVVDDAQHELVERLGAERVERVDDPRGFVIGRHDQPHRVVAGHQRLDDPLLEAERREGHEGVAGDWLEAPFHRHGVTGRRPSRRR